MRIPTRRIAGGLVPPLFPPDGTPIDTIVIGEAPGPRGADQSGVPFLGDRAGRLVFAALIRAKRCTFPVDFAAFEGWTGGEFARAAVRPVVRGIVLTNAFPRCPSDDRVRFRAPRASELHAAVNQRRLRQLVARAHSRGLRQILALGAVAARVMAPLTPAGIILRALPHPSAQGLLQAAPSKGKGLALATLEQAWIDALVVALA